MLRRDNNNQKSTATEMSTQTRKRNIYCTNCGSVVLGGWNYCKTCGKPIDHSIVKEAVVQKAEMHSQQATEIRQVQKKDPSKKKGRGKVVFIFLLAAVVVYFYYSPNQLSKVKDFFGIRESTPSPVVSLSPVEISNGRVVKYSSYKGVCPLTVKVPNGNQNYYIVLEYVRASSNSIENRIKKDNRGVNDMSFYVAAGKSASVSVPVGVYKVYYACGETWYGTKNRFGPNTVYYSSDDLLEFYVDENYYNGHTLELWLQTDGNFDRSVISESQFPD